MASRFYNGSLFLCHTKNRDEWNVYDVSKDTLLHAETNISDVTTLILKIDGHTDDTIKIQKLQSQGARF